VAVWLVFMSHKYLYFSDSVSASIYNSGLAASLGCSGATKFWFEQNGSHLLVPDAQVGDLPPEKQAELTTTEPAVHAAHEKIVAEEQKNVIVDGNEWQVRNTVQYPEQERIKRAIARGYSDHWKLADNRMIQVNPEMLQAVIDAVDMRSKRIWAQYFAWVAGDKAELFKYVESSE